MFWFLLFVLLIALALYRGDYTVPLTFVVFIPVAYLLSKRETHS